MRLQPPVLDTVYAFPRRQILLRCCTLIYCAPCSSAGCDAPAVGHAMCRMSGVEQRTTRGIVRSRGCKLLTGVEGLCRAHGSPCLPSSQCSPLRGTRCFAAWRCVVV